MPWEHGSHENKARVALAFAFAIAPDNPLMPDFGWQPAAVRGKLHHHLLVQPDIRRGGIIAVAGVTEAPWPGVIAEKFNQKVVAAFATACSVACAPQ
jgi:hypothetical protein